MEKISEFKVLENMVTNKDNSKYDFVLVTADSCTVCHSILDNLKEKKEVDTSRLANFEFNNSVVKEWLASEYFKKLVHVPILINLKDGNNVRPESYENFKNLIKD